VANFEGTTASEGGKIKKGKEAALRAYLSKFYLLSQGDDEEAGEEGIGAYIRGGWLHIYGYGDFSVPPLVDEKNADGEVVGQEPDYDNNDCTAFMEGLKPFLAKTAHGTGKHKQEYLLVVQTVGHEKCRFPLCAGEWVLRPSGKVEFNGFKHY